MSLVPASGMTWNPLLKYPPNNLCPCLSGKKFKKCCLPKVKKVIPNELAEKISKMLKGERIDAES